MALRADAARRGVQVGVVVDGFGSKATLPSLRRWLGEAGVQLVVFRPLDRWYAWLQPGQLRRLHQKLFPELCGREFMAFEIEQIEVEVLVVVRV
jgi:phosphatidylserine/phosphatidylglycerophosphate/cardiolipin synthase-like enzyme